MPAPTNAIWNTVKIQVPEKLLNTTKSNNITLKKGLTGTGLIAKTEGIPSIILVPANVNKASILNAGDQNTASGLKRGDPNVSDVKPKVKTKSAVPKPATPKPATPKPATPKPVKSLKDLKPLPKISLKPLPTLSVPKTPPMPAKMPPRPPLKTKIPPPPPAPKTPPPPPKTPPAPPPARAPKPKPKATLISMPKNDRPDKSVRPKIKLNLTYDLTKKPVSPKAVSSKPSTRPSTASSVSSVSSVKPTLRPTSAPPKTISAKPILTSSSVSLLTITPTSSELQSQTPVISHIPLKSTGYTDIQKTSASKLGAYLKAKLAQTAIEPYFNRVETIEDRQYYYNFIKKIIDNIADENKVSIETLEPFKKGYKLNNFLVLDSLIGSPSTYGIVYYSYFEDVDEDEFTDFFRFAVKFTENTPATSKEIEILDKLSEIAFDESIIHFPFTYYTSSMDISELSTSANYPNLFNLLIRRNEMTGSEDEMFMIINELASGDFNEYRRKYYNNSKYLLNGLLQTMMAVRLFHTWLASTHNDAHGGNFLYHKIKPGGYFQYKFGNKTFYIENLGYQWVIWDFSHTLSVKKSKTKFVNEDYLRLTGTLMHPQNLDVKTHPLDKNSLDIVTKLTLYLIEENNPVTSKKDLNAYFKYLFNVLIKEKYLITSIPSNSEVINKEIIDLD